MGCDENPCRQGQNRRPRQRFSLGSEKQGSPSDLPGENSRKFDYFRDTQEFPNPMESSGRWEYLRSVLMIVEDHVLKVVVRRKEAVEEVNKEARAGIQFFPWIRNRVSSARVSIS